ncbi:hypothetical protein [Nocardioides nanhaiensis]|uniref:TPM domain-containing protein n=1 Tax=Nocardioides nanhaiensis TaxID=1476871 RepID=A0ABP8W193_9ACTN
MSTPNDDTPPAAGSADQVLADVAQALADDGVYVHPSLASVVSPAEEAEIAQTLAQAEEPAFVVAYPFARNDEFGGSASDLLTRLQARDELPGTFITTSSYGLVNDEYSDIRLDAFQWGGPGGYDGQEWYELADAVQSRDPDGDFDLDQSLQTAADLVVEGREAVSEGYRERQEQREAEREERGSSPLGGDGDGVDLTGLLIAGLVAATVLAVARSVVRRRHGRAAAPARESAPAVLPPSAVERIREAHDRRLEERAQRELLALGEQLDSIEIGQRDERTSWQAALDHYDAARRVLAMTERQDDELDVLHVVGALVLLGRGRDALAAARKGRGYEPEPDCYLNPLHGRAAAARRVEVGGRPLEVPLCERCRSDLRRSRTPDILDVAQRGTPTHWFDTGVEPWVSTGYGALDPDLVTALQRTR